MTGTSPDDAPRAAELGACRAPSWNRQEALRLALFGRLAYTTEVARATPVHQQLVLCALVSSADAEGVVNATTNTVSIASLERSIHMDARSVRNAVHTLHELGHIHVVKRSGRPDVICITIGWFGEAGEPMTYRPVVNSHTWPVGTQEQRPTHGPLARGGTSEPLASRPQVERDPLAYGQGVADAPTGLRATGSSVDHSPQSHGSADARVDPEISILRSGNKSREDPPGVCDPDLDPTRATRERHTHTADVGFSPSPGVDPEVEQIRACLAQLSVRIPAFGKLAADRHVHVFAIGLTLGHTAGDICTAIQQSALKFGDFQARLVSSERRSFNPDLPVHVGKLEAFVGSFITGLKRRQRDDVHSLPEGDAKLLERFLSYWCSEYKRVWRKAYNVAGDGTDHRAALSVLAMARRAAQDEADEGKCVLDVERQNQIVKHWVTCYFRDKTTWVEEAGYTLKFFPRQATTYPRPRGASSPPSRPVDAEELAPVRAAVGAPVGALMASVGLVAASLPHLQGRQGPTLGPKACLPDADAPPGSERSDGAAVA